MISTFERRTWGLARRDQSPAPSSGKYAPETASGTFFPSVVVFVVCMKDRSSRGAAG
jgi:hypothetical protein